MLLVTAYAVLFFPLALIAIRPSVAQASPRLEEAARSLGQPPLAVFRRVTLPLIAPGLAAAVSIVFLSSVTELTATLVLRPTGTETLATRFWTYSSGLAYGAAAPYAALMIAISAVPTYFLVRWFDALWRRRAREHRLAVEGVAKSYGSTPVLSDVDADACPPAASLPCSDRRDRARPRSCACSRASTAPDRGRIALDGETLDDDQHHVPAHRRRIGYVPQDGLLFPHLTVAENVGFGLPAPEPAAARAVDELLELIGLGGLGQRRPHELSGGQQQRVAVARALAPEPRLILLDEPFAALDASLRDSLRAEIKQLLASLGTTVVLVTHDQEEALSLADSSPSSHDGRIVQHATPRAIYQRPKTLAVAHFLGEHQPRPRPLRRRHGVDVARRAAGRAARCSGNGEALVLIRPEQILLTRLRQRASAAAQRRASRRSRTSGTTRSRASASRPARARSI